MCVGVQYSAGKEFDVFVRFRDSRIFDGARDGGKDWIVYLQFEI